MSDLGGESVGVLSAAARETGAPTEKLPAGKWAKKNLFSNWYNSLITVVLGALSIYILYRFVRFLFITGQWEPIEVNLELLMIGLFPREERWRIITQLIMTAGVVGLGIGNLKAAAVDRAEETGEDRIVTTGREYLSNYWALGVFVLVMLVFFTSTIGPWLLLLGALAIGVVCFQLASRVPKQLRSLSWGIAALAGAVSFQVLSGTGGWAWFFTTAAVAPLVTFAVRPLAERLPDIVPWALVAGAAAVGFWWLVTDFGVFSVMGMAAAAFPAWMILQGDRIDAARFAGVVIAGLVVFVVYGAIGLDGVDWKDWGGFHLNLVATVASVVLAFPLGILLALGRRSTLPALRVMSVAFIEFFRGVPFISLLLTAQFFLGFFLDTDDPLSLITRAIVAGTLFAAAYIAEIIRGGLQAVPKGQIEAGQASGMSPPKIMRLIVMPQALRAVIPAMVGQFISLFKDTTLLTIISISEFLDVRNIIHSQEAFRGFGIGETLVFVAFGFWAVAFTMSRESQRLERRLGVGSR